MTSSLSDELLSRLGEVVASRMGLHFPRQRMRDLERGLEKAARDLGFEHAAECLERLLSSPLKRSDILVLAAHLTVGETYFFRDKEIFRFLEENVLPELIHDRRMSGRHIRFWSAGCSTGEEAYSIAILLKKMIPDIGDWSITVLATDINPQSLKVAAEGVYGPWSFRGTDHWIRDRFFIKRGDYRFEVLPGIREAVVFSWLNLVEDVYPSVFNNTQAMDVVFCRNVLMYMRPESARRVIQGVHRCLAEGGYLVVSPGELSLDVFDDFERLDHDGAVFYRKKRSSCRPAGLSTADGPSGKQAVPVEVAQAPVREIRGPAPAAEAAPVRGRDDLYDEAEAFYAAGGVSQARAKVEKLLSLYPSDAPAMFLMARVQANGGRLDEALEWCEKAIAVDKLQAAYHYLAATVLMELGRTEDASSALRRAIYLDRDFVPAYLALGYINRRLDRLAESDRYFRNAFSLLAGRDPEEVLPESEGVNVGRMMEIIKNVLNAEGEDSP